MLIEIPVDIKSLVVRDKQGTSKTGRPYHIREQDGYVDLGKAYPLEIKILLEEGAAPYLPGPYLIDQNCLYVNRFGQLALGRLKLNPAEPKKSR